MPKITPVREKWAGTMTDRERFVNQMHYQPVDRCFNREFGYWKECHDLWPVFVENEIRSEGDANVLFAFDRMSALGTNTWLKRSSVTPPTGSSRQLA